MRQWKKITESAELRGTHKDHSVQLLDLHRTISELRIFQAEELEGVTSETHYADLSVFPQNILFLEGKKSFGLWNSNSCGLEICHQEICASTLTLYVITLRLIDYYFNK